MRLPDKETFLAEFRRGLLDAGEVESQTIEADESADKISEGMGWAAGYWEGVNGCRSYKPLKKSGLKSRFEK